MAAFIPKLSIEGDFDRISAVERNILMAGDASGGVQR